MKREVSPSIFVGDDSSCQNGSQELVVVHACKHPCHVRAVGYSGSLPSSHPNYLVLEEEYDLFLNMIDPDRPLFMPPLFLRFLEFARSHWNENRSILIHCNLGESRSPTLALMFLAKELGEISNDSYRVAAQEYIVLDPIYRPGQGIQTYLDENWGAF